MATNTDITDLFNTLESNQPNLAEKVKNELHSTFNSVKESWILNGLYDYFVQTHSIRSVEIIASVREPHDRYFFDRVEEGLRSGNKVPALTLLGYVVRRQPPWIYKITQHQVFKTLLRLLKHETEIQPLMSALLILITLLPIIPASIGTLLENIFDIFSRLASWNCHPVKLEEDQLVHLQIGMYSLFLRLYGMYPCNFIRYLRQKYSQPDNLTVFSHTIKPMLYTVKMHPFLVTSSMEFEVSTERWRHTSHHDIMIECAKLTLDPVERTCEENVSAIGDGIRGQSASEYVGAYLESSPSYLLNALKHSIKTKLPTNGVDFFSPSYYFKHSSSPPLADSNIVISTSVPQTPNTTPVISTNYFNQEGISPPEELAVEATPEKVCGDLRLPSLTKIIPLNSHAAVNFWHNDGSISQSQPVSPRRSNLSVGSTQSAFEQLPVKKQPDLNRGSHFDFSQNQFPRHRLMKMIQDRNQAPDSVSLIHETRLPLSNLRPKTPGSNSSAALPSSPLKHYETSVPNSPVPVVEMSAGLTEPKEWTLAKPKVDKTPVGFDSNGTVQTLSQEDQEVDQIVQLGEKLRNTGEQYINNLSTPSNCPSNLSTPLQSNVRNDCDSVLKAYATPHNDVLQECDNEDPMGSSCSSGGLHMPNSRSLRDMDKKIRSRYYSFNDAQNTMALNSSGSSPGDVTDEIDLVKVRRANSCPEMKKNVLTVAIVELPNPLEEKDELIVEQQLGEKTTEVTCSTRCTQTVDTWPQPYESLFTGLFVTNVGTHPQSSSELVRAKSTDTSDVYNYSSCTNLPSRFSPYEIIDRYVETVRLASEHQKNMPGNTTKTGKDLDQTSTSTSTSVTPTLPGSGNTSCYVQCGSCGEFTQQTMRSRNPENEIRQLREQVELLYLHLQYERYRREVHAERNRRLSAKVKSSKSSEDYNSALQEQVGMWQRDYENLRAHCENLKTNSATKEKELSDSVDYWRKESKLHQGDKAGMQKQIEDLTLQLKSSEDMYYKLQMEFKEKEAMLLDMRRDYSEARVQAMHGENIRADLEYYQRQLLIIGELQMKYREKLALLAHLEHKSHQLDQLTETYTREVESLNQQHIVKNSMLESSRARIIDLENTIQRYDEVFQDQKRMLKSTKDEYQEQLNAVESKYKTQGKIFKRMEEQILDLYTKIDRYELGSRRGIRSPDSQSSSCGREIGGPASGLLVSPHSSPPLSVSLTSSEGGGCSSMSFLPSAAAITSDMEMKNLQTILDEQNENGETTKRT